MSTDWIRRPPRSQDSAAAGIVALATAVAVGTVTWYLTRTLLSREPISLRPEDGREGKRIAGPSDDALE